MRTNVELVDECIEAGADAGSACRDNDRVGHQALCQAAISTKACGRSDEAYRALREAVGDEA